MTTVLARAAKDRGTRFAVMALLAALLLTTQPLATADAHTQSYCGHGWSGMHTTPNMAVWDIQYSGYTSYMNPHIHRNLHYSVFISIWTGAVYSPQHYQHDYCPNH